MPPDQSRLRFARTPYDVLTDPELSHTDKYVYGLLSAHCFNGNIVTIGQRRLAELAHMDRRNVQRALEHLGRRGHVSSAIGRITRRKVYQLNSPVFLQDAERMASPQHPVMASPQHPRIDSRSPKLRRVK